MLPRVVSPNFKDTYPNRTYRNQFKSINVKNVNKASRQKKYYKIPVKQVGQSSSFNNYYNLIIFLLRIVCF